MALRIEIKHDVQDKTWIRLSVMLHHMITLPAAILAAQNHREQYAIDHQCNPHMLAVRIVDENGVELWRDNSNAFHNRQSNCS